MYVAQKLVASRPDSLTLGQLALGNIQNIVRDEIEPLLKKYGLEDIQPDQWYPVQNILDLYREISEGNTNVTQNLVAIGKKGAEVGPLPPEINSLDAWLDILPFYYPQVIRNMVDGEGFKVHRIGEHHVHIIDNTPYPEDLMYGYFWGLVARLKPRQNIFVVCVVDNPHPTEEPGTVFEVKWSAS